MSDSEWSRVDFYSTRFINSNLQNLKVTWSSILDCKLLETNWDNIYFEATKFYNVEIQGITFTNLDFHQKYPTIIDDLSVNDSKTFNEAIQKISVNNLDNEE